MDSSDQDPAESDYLRQQLISLETLVDERKLIIKDQQEKIKLLEEQLRDITSKYESLQTDLSSANHSLTTQSKKFQPLINNEGMDDEVVFYDGVIKVMSLRGLDPGWRICFRKDSNYEKRIKQESVILSVVGNYNRGKTWILGKLCEEFQEEGKEIPQGFSYSTEGISFRYTTKDGDDSKAPVLALDTKGSSTPINIESILKELEPIDMNTASNEVKKKQNDIFMKKFKECLIDHLATEDLLQLFITQISTVNLVLVSSLTFEDQRLINKLKVRDNNKTMIVVHNLYQCTKIYEVTEVHIKKRILPSFKLDKKQFVFDCKKRNNTYYQEDLPNGTSIVHLITAQEGTEAGDYYNENAIAYLRKKFETEKLKKVNLLAELKTFLENNLTQYIQTDSKTIKANLKLESDKSSEPERMVIKLDNIKHLSLKQVSSDESGMLQTNIQTYCMYAVTDDKGISRLVVKIESPSRIGVDNIKTKIETVYDQSRIIILGRKTLDDPEKKDMIHDIRREGEFLITTPWFSNKKYSLIKDKKNVDFIDGNILITYPCDAAPDEDDSQWD